MAYLSFRGILRPGQGFKPFRVLRRVGGLTENCRPTTSDLNPMGEFYGIISRASPTEIEQHKQLGHPITHTIVQYGAGTRANANDVLELTDGETTRKFLVQVKPHDHGELGHVLTYKVEERDDLQ